MKNVITILLLIGFTTLLTAQMQRGGGHFQPDSLENITVSGSVIIDEGTMNSMYYLDADNNGPKLR